MKKLYMLFIALIPVLVWGQVAWNFGTAAPGAASPSSGVPIANITSISDLMQGNNNGTTPLLSTTSASSTYPGASASYNAGAAARTGALNTAAGGSAYFEFTLTPTAGYSVGISQINFGTRSTATGPAAYYIRTSADNYATDIATGTIVTAGSPWALKTNATTFNGAAGAPVTVRIYGAAGAGSPVTGTANWRIDDLAVPATATGSGPAPSITVDATGLAIFHTTAGTASAPQTVTVSASNLATDLTITPISQFEISLDGGTNYSTSAITISPSGASITNAPVTIRVAATASFGPYAKDISFSAGTATQLLRVDADVQSNGVPIVTIDSSGLVPFTTTSPSPSATQSFTVSGTNISNGGISLSPGDNFEISADGGASFVSYPQSLGLTSTAGVVSTATFLTRIKANAPTGPVTGVVLLGTFGETQTYLIHFTGTVNPAVTANVVINQVYGGGGNSGATYKNDFIELYNNDDTAVNLAGWSVQYSAAAGTGTWQVHALNGIVPPHSFFLIQEGAGAAGTVNLPTPDAIGTLALSGTAGKVLLSNTITAQTGANPAGTTIMDKVGYGAAASGFETAPTAGTDNATSVTRIADGADNNNNSTDFALGAPIPRNSTYKITPPAILSLTPPNGTSDLPYNIHLSIIFDKKVVKGTGTITLYENGIAGTPLDVNDAGVVISNNTNVSFPSSLSSGKSYYVVVSAGAFKDVYSNNFTGITGTTGWAFTTYNAAASVPVPVSFDFQNCTGSGLLPNGFTQYSVNGSAVWDCTSFGRDPVAPSGTAPFPAGVQINGFDNALGNVLNTDWLISPALDITGTTYPLLSFYSRTRFNGAPLQLKVSTDYTGTGDPNLATWTDLNGKFAAQTSDTWTLSSNINLAAFKQTRVYIAFLYTSTNDDGARWTLDDISIINSSTPPPPSLSASTNSIEFFYAAAGTSITKQFAVIGNDLTGGAGININATGNFEVSKDNTSFASSINFTEAAANNISETVFVRFSPAQDNQNFTGTVTVSTFGTTDTVINVKGTSIDPAKTLEVVNWNMEWFGSPDLTLGPTNKVLQKQNAQIILPSIKADLYALVEVVDTAALGDIVRTSMPGYGYVICNYGSHGNPFESGASPLNVLQKEAFVYKTSVFSNIDTTSLLSLGVNTAADLSNPDYNFWSSGRYPFMMTADVTLEGVIKRVHFIAVHAKANTSPTVTAYNRRKSGADDLHTYLNTTYPNDNIVILGDFNDDLDSTITDGISPRLSSYKTFTDDAASFYSPTLVGLSLTGKKSTISYNDVIDHVVVSNEMKPFFMKSSAAVLTDVTSLVANYGSTTSDHYPVFTRYAFDAALLPVRLVSFTANRDGNTVKLAWKSAEESNSKEYIVQRSADGLNFTTIGTVAAKGIAADYSFTDSSPLTGSNFYRLKPVDKDGKSAFSKVVAVNFTKLPGVRISPNPANSYIYMSLENINSSVNLQIIDVNGKIMKQQVIAQGTAAKTISLSGIAKGLYTVKLISQEKVVTQKLLIQ